MSQKIRIGNDIDIRWSLVDENENPYILEGRDVRIELNVGKKKIRITEIELNENTVHFIYYGKDQKYTGQYILKFIENDGNVEMVTFDTKDAFTLVEHSWLAIDDGEEPERVYLEFVTVTSNILERIGPTGPAAGFGEVTASIDAGVGTPTVDVSTSGPDTAKNITFNFHNLKGASAGVKIDLDTQATTGQEVTDALAAGKVPYAVMGGYIYYYAGEYSNTYWFEREIPVNGLLGGVPQVARTGIGKTGHPIGVAAFYTAEDTAHKAYTISDSSTHDQYPSAKAVYDSLLGKDVYVAKATNNVYDWQGINTAINAGKAIFAKSGYTVYGYNYTDYQGSHIFYAINDLSLLVLQVDINGTAQTSSVPIQTLIDSNNKLDFSLLSNTPTTIAGYGITNAYTKNEIDAKVSSVYKPAGSAASVAALGSLTAANLGNVYNMSAAFTTTSDFVEGASKDYPAGTNVVIVNTGTDADPVYKYDVLAGMVDLSGCEKTANKVNTISGNETNTTKYPSAKAVNDFVVANKQIFLATYGTTTASEIIAANAAGKAVFVIYDNKQYELARINSGSCYFCAAMGATQYRVEVNNNNVWANSIVQLQASNLVTSFGSTPSDSKYPSEKLVKDSLDAKQNVISSSKKLDYSLIDNVPQDATPVSQSDQQFTFRQTAGGAKPGASLAKVTEVRGKSLVWNQQLPVFGGSSWSYARATINLISNEEVEVTGNTEGNAGYYIYLPLYSINGHKYYVRVDYKGSSGATGDIRFGGHTLAGLTMDGNWHTATEIYAASRADRFFIIADYNKTISAKKPEIIDLTLMFGAGNEPTTVAEFEALYPLPYYAYNAGTLLNNKTTALETVRFNQWDEEWQLGYYNEGVPIAASTQIRSNKDKPIPVFPNTNYFIHCGANTGRVSWIFWYDAGDNYISKTQIGQSNEEVTSPDNARFARFQCDTAYGTTYNHDICINLSDPAKNGTYQPYEKHTLTLNLPTLTGKLNGEGSSVTIAADGLKSAGSAYDYGVVENGFLTKIVKVIESVDLGDGVWTRLFEKTVFRRFLETAKAPSSNYAPANIMCANYVTTGSGYVESSQSGIGLSVSKMITIGDSRYSDATDFGTAMSGVLLYYELATPLTYILDTPIPVTYFVNDLGTESITPTGVDANGVPNTAPFRASLQYGLTEGEMYELMGDSSSAPVQDVTVGGTSVVSDGTAAIPAIPSVPTISTDIATDKSSTTKTASPSAVYNEVHPAIATTQPAGGFLPNVVYDLGTLTGTVTFALASPTDANIANPYYWTFETGSTAPTITWPANITWAGGSAPTISASKHYEIMIRNSYASALEF